MQKRHEITFSRCWFNLYIGWIVVHVPYHQPEGFLFCDDLEFGAERRIGTQDDALKSAWRHAKAMSGQWYIAYGHAYRPPPEEQTLKNFQREVDQMFPVGGQTICGPDDGLD